MKGPLHGLPVSLKDQIPIKGLETTMGIDLLLNLRLDAPLKFQCIGYAAWVGKYAEHDAVMVKLLLQAGGVPFVRTNLPQTIMVRQYSHTH